MIKRRASEAQLSFFGLPPASTLPYAAGQLAEVRICSACVTYVAAVWDKSLKRWKGARAQSPNIPELGEDDRFTLRSHQKKLAAASVMVRSVVVPGASCIEAVVALLDHLGASCPDDENDFLPQDLRRVFVDATTSALLPAGSPSPDYATCV